MECVQKTSTDVTEYIFGRCTASGVKGGIGIPGFDSFLVGGSTSTQVTGLDTVPPDDRPPDNTLHPLVLRRDGRDLHAADRTRPLARDRLVAEDRLRRARWFLRATALSGVAAVVALECGWIVTEVGRQPWIVHGVMRTSDAVTQANGIWVTFDRDRSSCTSCSGRR